MNHFAKKCRTRVNQVYQCGDTPEYESEEDYVLAVEPSEDKAKYPKKLFANMTINKKEDKLQLDCGATVNILPEKIYRYVNNDPEMRKLAETTTTLVMYNDTQTQPLGKVNVTLRNPKNSKKYNLEFVVMKGSAN